MKKFLSLLTIALLLVAIVGCKKEDKSEGVKLYVTFKGEKFITYNESTPWDAPNGKTYQQGDLLPAWEATEEALDLDIIDATPHSGSDQTQLLETASANNFADANIFIGSPRTISDYGLIGGFVKLDEHLDKMPNFKAFLDTNPVVAQTLTQADGHIYMAPYFDDMEEVEVMYMMKHNWVISLLDSVNPVFDTVTAPATAYEPFYNYNGSKVVNGETYTITENIIDIQNALPVKNGETYTNALKTYIADVYGDKYEKLSDFYLSSDAAYDADELVALMRAVKANNYFLRADYLDGIYEAQKNDANALTLAEVVAANEAVIYFARQSTDYQKIKFLMTMWGIGGVQSRNNYFRFGQDGNLEEARMEDDFLDGMELMHQLYSEGLIIKDYEQAMGTIKDFRKNNFITDNGFLSVDYNASTVNLHTVDGVPSTTVVEVVVPPTAQWFGDEFVSFTESVRSVKPDGGWGIASHTKGATLDDALAVVDFPFSTAGNEIFSFGPRGLYWNDYTSIGGKQYPALNDQFVTDMNLYTSGNWSNFMRGYVGATFGIGFVKSTIALETQTSNEHYLPGINRLAESNMISGAFGEASDARMKVVPSIFPLTEDEVIATKTYTFGAYFIEHEVSIIKYGFGNDIPGSDAKVPTRAEFLAELKARGIEDNLAVNQTGYNRTK